jgi:hypothetical protein
MSKFRGRALFISLIVFTLGITQLHGLQLAHADEGYIVLQDGPIDQDNFDDLPTDYDITQIAFGIEEDYPDFYEFFISFINPITPYQFDGSNGSFASLMLDLDNDGEEDFSIDTSDEPYVGNTVHAAILTDRRNNRVTEISSCNVETWSNIENKATWIAFAIPMNCLDFGTTFGILGYAGSDVGENNYDYSDDDFWVIDPTENDAPKSTVAGESSSDLPAASSDRMASIPNPADAPADLSSLSRDISDSVVTVFCGQGSGSGWSAKVDLTESMVNNGVKSFLITNFHVIEECVDGREIQIQLADGKMVAGRVTSWNQPGDLAGIVTTEEIEGLDWVGPAPEQGWWVGVIGSPLGQPGILTTGIASSAPANFEGFMSAPINPGNSGGPVFDNTGRVIGVASAIRLIQSRDELAQGFNIYMGTPLLCGKVIDCSASDIWAGSSGSLFPSGAGLYIPLGLLATGAIIGAIFFTRRKRTSSYAASTFAQSPNYNRSMPPPPGSMPPPPGSMPPPPGSMPPPPGSMPPRPPGSR